MPDEVINRVHDIAIRQKSPEGLTFPRQNITKFVNIDGNDNDAQEVDNIDVPVEEENLGAEDVPWDVALEDNDKYHEPVVDHDTEAARVGIVNNSNSVPGEIAGVDEEDVNDEYTNDEE